METPPSPSSRRRGTPGLDLFKIAGRSISGFLPSLKTGDPHHVRQPFTTQLEERLALYLEYHPQVRSYQRGDASEAFAQAHHLNTPLGTPYRIAYLYNGTAHDYLPDFVGTLCDGGLLVAEAGRASDKRHEQAVAKAEAAHRLAQLKGGEYWLGTEEGLSLQRHYNWLYLHARRQPFSTYEEIAATVLTQWPWGESASVSEWVERFGRRWSASEVEAAVWKLAGDAAAAGRLLVDLTEVELARGTPLVLLDPSAAPILPDPLPPSLMPTSQGGRDLTAAPSSAGPPPERRGGILGPTFDASTLAGAEERERFHRNLAAVQAVLAGEPRRRVAKRYEMHPFTLARLERGVEQFGQLACVPRATYHRERKFRPEFEPLLRQLYSHPIRPSVMAVYEDVRIAQLADRLSAQEGTRVSPPSYRQVWSFLQAIRDESPVSEARSGLKHPPSERSSASSFVLSIPFPAFICQVDEHTLDQLVVALDGAVITQRVHAAVLICVKTAAILGAVLSLGNPTEEDYMRLLKQALEPKEALVARYDCTHPWPCYGKPTVIFHDRGKIFTSERATQVVVDRLRITTEQAPPFAPSAKGTVEALFAWTTRKFEHRLPGTTKATVQARGSYDSAREAEKAGITLEVLEQLFFQAIVDGYMQEWDTLRRGKRITLWEESVRDKGVPRGPESQDDLKLLLMKARNRKNRATGRYAITQGTLSFLGRRYVSPGLLDRLRGKEIDIFYDRRDLSVIYLFLEGVLVGEAYCPEFMGRRVSVWEAKVQRLADASLAKEAEALSRASRQRLQQTAIAGRRVLSLERKRLEQQRLLEQQRQEIHPAHVQAVLHALAQHQRPTGSLPPTQKGLLAPAIPEEENPEVPVVHLPVRKLEAEHE
jgi:hypothetical protein